MNNTLGAEGALAEFLLTEQPDEAARLLEIGDDSETARLLEATSAELAFATFRRLTPEKAARVLASLSEEVRGQVLSSLDHNRAASLLARLDPEERESCLKGLDTALEDELRSLLEYPPETAGSLMDPRANSFRPDATTRDVVRRLRGFRARRVQDVFLVDPVGALVGSIPLETIVLAEEGARLDSLVLGPLISVPATASREAILQTFEENRVGSLPVTDIDGRLVGVLRQRELIEVAQERATASAVRMVGASDEERALSSPAFAIRKRLPWLEINLVTAFVAAAVVGLFEETIASVTALAILLPVVAG